LVIDGGGSVISTGTKADLFFDWACTILGYTMLGDQTGSIVVDIYKCTYSQYDAGSTHPVAGDTITGSSKPIINNGTKNQDTTLSGWTTSVAANDVLRFQVTGGTGPTSTTRVTIALKVQRS